MNNEDNEDFLLDNKTNDGREFDHCLSRQWAIPPEPSANAPYCEDVQNIDGTIFQVSTVKGVAGMIKVKVIPPIGQTPWCCSMHCHHLDITHLEFKKIGETVRVFISYSNGDQNDLLVEPLMGCR